MGQGAAIEPVQLGENGAPFQRGACPSKQKMLHRIINARRAAWRERLLHSACIRQASRRPPCVGLANIAAPAYSLLS
jgi:hypothetical protein